MDEKATRNAEVVALLAGGALTLEAVAQADLPADGSITVCPVCDGSGHMQVQGEDQRCFGCLGVGRIPTVWLKRDVVR